MITLCYHGFCSQTSYFHLKIGRVLLAIYQGDWADVPVGGEQTYMHETYTRDTNTHARASLVRLCKQRTETQMKQQQNYALLL